MISYTFYDDRGQYRKLEFDDLNRALYVAANHHERDYYINSIRDGNKKYSRDDVLLMCHKYGFL